MSDLTRIQEALEWDGPEHAGVQAARRFARWHLGDESWADMVLGAVFDPATANAKLDREQAGA